MSVRAVQLMLAVVLLMGMTGACSNESNGAKDCSGEYTTATGITVHLEVTTPQGQSLNSVHIRSEGFEYELDETLENVDPLTDVFLADIDGDGYDEMYLVSTSAGSGSIGTLRGYASNRDRSMSMIHMPAFRDEAYAEGYMGHDSFSVEGGRIVRRFPVYREGDSNASPSGGTRVLRYKLLPGEAMWQLRVEHVDEEER